MARGDHLQASREWGHHHDGIDIGHGLVVHLAADNGGSKSSATVRIERLEVFAGGGVVTVKPYAQGVDPETTVARALSRVGDGGYDLVANNCEHFAFWCVTGRHESQQVTMVGSTVGVAGTTATAMVFGGDLIASAGIVAGMSGSGIMSGLAATGGFVGGGAVAGLGVLGAAPGLASVAIVHNALKDDQDLPQDERDARAAGRTGAVVGAGAGLVGGIGAVSAMGTVSGLSAAGISSGLAAVGAGFGGGMAAGTMAVVAAPAAAAAVVGYGFYRLVRWLRSA
jgi:hypothetical protein